MRTRFGGWLVLAGLAGLMAIVAWPSSAGAIKKSDSVVKVEFQVEPKVPGPDGTQRLVVSLDIDKGYHIYANPVGLESLAGSQTTLRASARIDPELKVEYPAGKLVPDKEVGDYRIYEGQVRIQAMVRRMPGDTGPLELNLKFQACSDRSCLLPATVKHQVP